MGNRLFKIQSEDIMYNNMVIYTLIDRPKPGRGYDLDLMLSGRSRYVYKRAGYPDKIFFPGLSFTEARQASQEGLKMLAERQQNITHGSSLPFAPFKTCEMNGIIYS